MDMHDFRTKLRLRMETLGLSQMDVARLCGVHQGSLSRFLAGTAGLSGESVLRLIPVLGDSRLALRKGRQRQRLKEDGAEA